MEAQIQSALTNAVAALQEVGTSLKGGGQESHDALTALTRKAASLHGTATTVRDYLTQFTADETLPEEHRRKNAINIHQAARDRIRDDYEAIIKRDLPALEHSLGEATLPHPTKDTGQRQLARQELGNLLAGATGADVPFRMMQLLGRNPDWDAEMLSSHGQTLLEAAGIPAHDIQGFRKGAVEKLLSSTVGSERMLANRKAINALRSKNLKGAVTSIYAIAQHRLGDAPREPAKPDMSQALRQGHGL